MKKIGSILILGIFVISILTTSTAIDVKENSNLKENKEKINDVLSYEDELDQFQTEQTEGFGIPVGAFQIGDPPTIFYVQVAQSFIPTKQMLTRVELYVGRNATASHPYIVAIREELTEGNLVEIGLEPDEFVIQNYSWVEFDFDDISVNVGQTYYIVSYTENVTDNYYAWAFNNDSESYEHGCAWVSLDEGDTWTNESYSTENQILKHSQGIAPIGKNDNTSDMCFKTYGADSTELDISIEKTGTSISATITNNGDIPAINVEWTLTAQGGLLGYVNKTSTDIIPELDVDDSISVPMGLLFGLGPVKITAVAKGENTLEVSDSLDIFLLIIFII